MSKYCTKCGKKQENCICEVKEAKYEKKDNSQITSDFKKYTLDFIKKPFDAVDNFINSTTNDLSYIFILIASLIISILLVQFRCINMMYIYENIPYLRYFATFTFYTFIIFISFSFIITLISKYIFKEEIEYNKIIKVTGISSLALTYIGLIIIIINSLYTIMSLILIVIAIILFSLLFNYGISKISNINKNKIPYLYITTILVMIIIKYILN